MRIADHFCALVEEVFVPIFRNVLNLAKFPECVADGEKEKDCSKIVSSCKTKYFPRYRAAGARAVHQRVPGEPDGPDLRLVLHSVLQVRGHIKGKTLLPFPQVRFPSWLAIGLNGFCFPPIGCWTVSWLVIGQSSGRGRH